MSIQRIMNKDKVIDKQYLPSSLFPQIYPAPCPVIGLDSPATYDEVGFVLESPDFISTITNTNTFQFFNNFVVPSGVWLISLSVNAVSPNPSQYIVGFEAGVGQGLTSYIRFTDLSPSLAFTSITDTSSPFVVTGGTSLFCTFKFKGSQLAGSLNVTYRTILTRIA